MDYSGYCLCCPSNFKAMEEQDLSYEEAADYLSFPKECKNLAIYLNTKEKWMETVLQSNCIHRWLHLMEGIFTSNIDACSERLITTNLTNDLIDIYPYNKFEGDYSFEYWMILHEEEEKGRRICAVPIPHLNMDCWLLFVAAFCFSCGGCGMNCIGEYYESVPSDHTGFYVLSQ